MKKQNLKQIKIENFAQRLVGRFMVDGIYHDLREYISIDNEISVVEIE